MNEYDGEPKEPCGERNLPEISRRRFLGGLSVALGGAMAMVLGAPVVGFIFGPLFRKSPGVWRSVGKVDHFVIGETVPVIFQDASPLPWAGVTANTAAWLRRESADTFIAFVVNCSHLGCPVRWLKEADLFMCPCHGGVYNKDGTVAAGPPPRPLSRYQVRVNAGNVEIQTQPIPIG